MTTAAATQPFEHKMRLKLDAERSSLSTQAAETAASSSSSSSLAPESPPPTAAQSRRSRDRQPQYMTYKQTHTIGEDTGGTRRSPPHRFTPTSGSRLEAPRPRFDSTTGSAAAWEASRQPSSHLPRCPRADPPHCMTTGPLSSGPYVTRIYDSGNNAPSVWGVAMDPSYSGRGRVHTADTQMEQMCRLPSLCYCSQCVEYGGQYVPIDDEYGADIYGGPDPARIFYGDEGSSMLSAVAGPHSGYSNGLPEEQLFGAEEDDPVARLAGVAGALIDHAVRTNGDDGDQHHPPCVSAEPVCVEANVAPLLPAGFAPGPTLPIKKRTWSSGVQEEDFGFDHCGTPTSAPPQCQVPDDDTLGFARQNPTILHDMLLLSAMADRTRSPSGAYGSRFTGIDDIGNDADDSLVDLLIKAAADPSWQPFAGSATSFANIIDTHLQRTAAWNFPQQVPVPQDIDFQERGNLYRRTSADALHNVMGLNCGLPSHTQQSAAGCLARGNLPGQTCRRPRQLPASVASCGMSKGQLAFTPPASNQAVHRPGQVVRGGSASVNYSISAQTQAGHSSRLGRGGPSKAAIRPIGEQRYFEARGPKPLLHLLSVLERENSLSPKMLTALLLHFLPSISQRAQKKAGRLNGIAASTLLKFFYVDSENGELTMLGKLLRQAVEALRRSVPVLATHADNLEAILEQRGTGALKPGTAIVDALKALLKVPFKAQVSIVSELAEYITPLWEYCLSCCSGTSASRVTNLSLDDVTHWGYDCSNCLGEDMFGPRFHCETCGLVHRIEFNICGPCFLKKHEIHYASHTFTCLLRDVDASASAG